MSPSESSPVRVTVCEDGPFIVRGPVEIVDDQGRRVETSRTTVALCRCGLSSRAPWCDGSHKAATGLRRRPGSS